MDMPSLPPSTMAMSGPCEAILDTNVVLDWLVFADSRIAPLAAAVTRGELRWIASQAVFDELLHVLQRPGLEAWKDNLKPALTCLETTCCIVDAAVLSAGPGLICSDSSDQKFIDLAISRRTPWLLTRDKALLRLARRAKACGVDVCTPAAWCAQTTELAAGRELRG